MLRKPILLLFIMAVVAAVSTLYLVNYSTSSVLLSTDAAKILSGDSYYLNYTTQWLLSDNQSVEFEEVKSGSAFLQKYEMDCIPLITITNNKTTTVYWGNELIDQRENTEVYSSPYSTLEYSGKSGNIRLDESEYFYEEYKYINNDENYRLRFLFSGSELWGLQFDNDDVYVEVTALSHDIPQNLMDIMK